MPETPLQPSGANPGSPDTKAPEPNTASLYAPRFRIETVVPEGADSTNIGAPRVFLRQLVKAPRTYAHPVRGYLAEDGKPDTGQVYSYGVCFEFSGEDNRLSRGSSLYFLYSFDGAQWFQVAICSDERLHVESPADYIALDRDSTDLAMRVFSKDREVAFTLPEAISSSDTISSFTLYITFVLETEITNGTTSGCIDAINLNFDSIEVYELDPGGGGGYPKGTTSPPGGPMPT